MFCPDGNGEKETLNVQDFSGWKGNSHYSTTDSHDSDGVQDHSVIASSYMLSKLKLGFLIHIELIVS